MSRDECLQEFETYEADPIDAALYCRNENYPTSSKAGGVIFVAFALMISIVLMRESKR